MKNSKVRYRCGHQETKAATACHKEPRSADEKAEIRSAGLRGLPGLLPWCPVRSRYFVASIRLRGDCREEKRREMREAEAQVRYNWTCWKKWKTKEDENERKARKQKERESCERRQAMLRWDEW